jgi:hypothetical protein
VPAKLFLGPPVIPNSHSYLAVWDSFCRRSNLCNHGGQLKLRPATAADYPFALGLYLRRPYTEKLMVWDEQKQIASFARQWKVEDVQVICANSRDVG